LGSFFARVPATQRLSLAFAVPCSRQTLEKPSVSMMEAVIQLRTQDALFTHPGRLNFLDFFYYARAAEESTNTPQIIYIEELDDYCSDLDWYDSAWERIPDHEHLALWKTNILSLTVQSDLRL
jgi:hypothetical protein